MSGGLSEHADGTLTMSALAHPQLSTSKMQQRTQVFSFYMAHRSLKSQEADRGGRHGEA